MQKSRVIDHLIETLTEERDAEGDPARKGELERQLQIFRFLPRREYDAKADVVIPSTLVELRHRERVSFCYLVPQGGGWITQIDGVPLQVLTPQSPLGVALLGKKAGDRVSVEVRGETREYEIVSLV